MEGHEFEAAEGSIVELFDSIGIFLGDRVKQSIGEVAKTTGCRRVVQVRF